eukprot:75640_1
MKWNRNDTMFSTITTFYVIYGCYLLSITSSYLLPRDFNVINDLYTHLNGNNWLCQLNITQLNNTNKHISDQCGFNFTNSTIQTIQKIELSDDENINGTLPSSISNLTNLISLHLENVAIYGSIPNTICNLVHLEVFHIYDTYLEGEIPDCMITNLSNLSTFYLSVMPRLHLNDTGAQLGCYWNNLKTFNLVYINYTGIIPNCISTQYLRWFQLSDLPGLHGTLPSSIIYNTTTLELVSLVWLPALSGTIDDAIFVNNKLLNAIYMEYIPMISMPIPDVICNLTNLLEFFWYGDANNFRSTIPSCFGQNFEKMLFFLISGSAFYGTIPKSICLMDQLLGFFLLDTYIDGTIPNCVSNFTNLIFIDIEDNMHLKGNIIDFNSNKTQLIVMTNNSFENSFSDKFVLPSYPQLQYVALHENNFADKDISDLLKKLFLYSPLLTAFSVYNNKNIGGTIPDFTHDVYLNFMQIFAVHNCDIYGSLPKRLHFGNNVTLSAITLYNNRLSSDIPTDLMLQSNVTPVIIYGNLFSITGDKNDIKWMNNSLFINTNLFVDETTQITNWCVLIFCGVIVVFSMLQKLYQCYQSDCFKMQAIYFSNKSMIFLANIRT